uniref:Nuclear egress lamina protein n=1 Tax=Mastomys natalensis cytomegalovirus 1 TaxID=2973541 RepID=A0A9Y1IKZ7_9BETA|nr:nuclear egress lamina protein [Mastomys natalensis cytomegalovirus 1]WEG68921.1 nuclear egress lamina protein [Mastomys natalensis cytomegalovirus 1]WEG71149.1 nuclear egress lamina protein [Mastomys natalensis cytomegalovirus 1]
MYRFTADNRSVSPCMSPRPKRRRSTTPVRLDTPARSTTPPKFTRETRGRQISRPPTPFNKRHSKTKQAPEFPYRNMKLSELHAVFQENPELEQKYLKMMKLPITGKESIRLPFNLRSHRQHTCLDFSPYGNDQVSRSACTTCKESTQFPTASDSMVAFINQTTNVMRHRRFYFGFRKNMELVKMSANQPQLFQIYYIVQSCIQDIFPILYYENEKLHMQLIFENEQIHIPSQCIEHILTVAKDSYNLSINIFHDRLSLTVMCQRLETTSVRIDVLVLQRKIDEMDIPNEINEKFERYFT